jgi:hypothetical protein
VTAVEWEPRFRPSWLCLKERGKRSAVVVRVAPAAVLGAGKHRMYEAWLNGRKIYDPADEYKVGQVIPLES